MAELKIFDLQRFAIHDGPGIRTTVFLKGCPLDCVWCHNPESKSPKSQLKYLEKNCIFCGECEKVCGEKVHILYENVHKIQFRNCIQCGKCVDSCINQALSILGKEMTTADILDIVLKDWDFYVKSGGGLTVSGGEPMMQFEALYELLKKAKEKGLHTCLDTSGQAATEKYQEISKYVDIFLYDYKITDPLEHKKYIGVDNTLILKNLKHLLENGNTVFLRCPIIPGINDFENHYRAIVDLSKKYDNIQQVNLMTYHDMAKGKASQIGTTYALEDVKTIGKEEKKQLYREFERLGCRNLSI